MIARFIIVLFLAVSLTGCIVLKSDYDKALAEPIALRPKGSLRQDKRAGRKP